MVVLTTETVWLENLYYRKVVLTKKNIQGMLDIFYILSEKCFKQKGGDPPPDRGHVP